MPVRISSIVVGLTLLCGLTTRAAAWESEGLRLRGRAQVRWAATEQRFDEPRTDRFLLRRMRVDARWMAAEWLRLVAELDASDAVKAKDLYARLDLHDLLRVTAGQFKKPFSRLRMSSPFELVIPERGLLDRYVIGDSQYGGFGGRDTGLMASGTWEGPVKLRYWVGGFNNLLTARKYHRDYVGRAQIRLFKGLILAVDACHKRYDVEVNDQLGVQTETRSATLLGADLRWTFRGFRLDLEAARGENVGTDPDLEANRPTINNGVGNTLYGAHATVSYEVQVMSSLRLIPALMAEVFDPDDQQDEDRALRLAAAINADIGEHVRVVLAAERVDKQVRYDAPNTVFVQLNLAL